MIIEELARLIWIQWFALVSLLFLSSFCPLLDHQHQNTIGTCITNFYWIFLVLSSLSADYGEALDFLSWCSYSVFMRNPEDLKFAWLYAAYRMLLCYSQSILVMLLVNFHAHSNHPFGAGVPNCLLDDRGCWIMGFYGKLEECSSLEAELWGIFKGLELIQSQGMEGIEINSDSTAAISLINEDASAHSPLGILIQECKALMALTGCSLKHIYREGNQVADKLANLGVDQEHNWVSHISPPEDIIPLLEADMRGVAYERI